MRMQSQHSDINVTKRVSHYWDRLTQSWLFYFALFAGLFIYVNSDVLRNMSTNLLDRLDYPYIVWVINANIQKITSGNFTHYFDTRGFYPHPYGLLFSDILLPQSLMVLLTYVLNGGKLILAFNTVYVATYMLNYSAAYVFWRQFFASRFLAWIGSLLIVFGPFYHMQKSHFQMQSYWVGLFALVFMFRAISMAKGSAITRNAAVTALVAGLLLGLQFTASVYIFVFLSSFAALAWIVRILYAQGTARGSLMSLASVMAIATALVSGPFIRAYYVMKNYYGMEREMGEIILYAAHATDYVFTRVYSTMLYNLPVWAQWNQFDHHIIGEKGVFPGFFLVILSAVGLWGLGKVGAPRARMWALHLRLDPQTVLFVLLGVAGFVASLGPRLSFNGTYAHIPTPYYAALKVLPMLDGIRSPARWEFILIITLIFFALRGLEKIAATDVWSRLRPAFRIIFPMLLVAWILFEYLPTPAQTYRVPAPKPHHAYLQKHCQNEPDTVVVEYPVTHFTAYGGIVEGLGYISGTQLAQVTHGCLLMNGYSGFIPEQVFETERTLNSIIERGDADGLYAFATANNVDFIAFNEAFILREYRAGFKALQKSLEEDARFEMVVPGMVRTR